MIKEIISIRIYSLIGHCRLDRDMFMFYFYIRFKQIKNDGKYFNLKCNRRN